jgi:predicted RNA binding protein YcfA (HicA-like mRNA interferase family)
VGRKKLKNLTAKEVLEILKKDGWYVVKQKGSHVQLKHPTKKGKVTVPVHSGKTLPIGTIKSIFKQAGIEDA